MDICAEEIGNNIPPAVGMVGDLKSVLAQVPVLLFVHTFVWIVKLQFELEVEILRLIENS